jgi:hypothetical protein
MECEQELLEIGKPTGRKRIVSKMKLSMLYLFLNILSSTHVEGIFAIKRNENISHQRAVVLTLHAYM